MLEQILERWNFMEDFYLRREKEKAPESVRFRGFYGAVGGIRTLVPLLTTTRFPEME